jgi:hypothetical protein
VEGCEKRVSQKNALLGLHCMRPLLSRPRVSRCLQSLLCTLHPPTQRDYFYLLDCRGQLFLEDTRHRNFVTSLKDKPFLNFFYRQLRPNSSSNKLGYPVVSMCGKERNFVKVQDNIASLVFAGSFVNGDCKLYIGQSDINQEFDPSKLYVDEETGRFYHRVEAHRHLHGTLGLLHPSISDQLACRISVVEGNRAGLGSGDQMERSTDRYSLRWHDGRDYEICRLHLQPPRNSDWDKISPSA